MVNQATETRELIKAEMRGAGWRRMRGNRPLDGQVINVAIEWIDRRYGTTEQFLVYCGTYFAASDSIAIGDVDDHATERPAKRFHWWMLIYQPTDANVLNLKLGAAFQGMAANAIGYDGRL